MAARNEFIRRFLLHVLPRGFHRIGHYGLLGGSSRKASLARARQLLAIAPEPSMVTDEEAAADRLPPCLCGGGGMIVIEIFARWHPLRALPDAAMPIRARVP
uniref:transposase n=1 Tax=Novosphingobium organovorum TaxID=2930092 RepID=UPI0038991124